MKRGENEVAPKINVKCLYCGEIFDRNSEENIKIGRRYAHTKCDANKEVSQDAKDLAQLHDYLKGLFKEEYDYLALSRQIEGYMKTGEYTYSGILKALVWWYEVKENSLEKSNNRIGIVPYIYKDAYKYYLALFMANQNNISKNLADYKNPETIIVRIKTPARELPKFRLFDLDD